LSVQVLIRRLRRPVALMVFSGIVWAPTVDATDPWEPDDPSSVFIYVAPGHPPQSRDVQSIGGAQDIDWIRVLMRPLRSYEVRLSNQRSIGDDVISLDRFDFGRTALLQSGSGWLGPSFSTGGRWYLRWETDGNASSFAAINSIRIVGSSSSGANSPYTFSYVDTTLFCPRFNNTNGQVSVLIVQGILEGTNSCALTAHFRNEVGAVLGSQTGIIDADGKVVVISTPSITGVANQKGGAQITHTCGYGNLKAKLVALEPATGFSFDTQCSMREQ
jgi:hypothetical protein